MRWIVRILSGIVMLLLIVAATLFLIPTEEVARIAARQVQATTNRALTIEGPVKASFWPGIAVETGPVRLANAEWAGEAPMIEAESLRISLDAASLLRGDIRITGLDLQAPRLRLERHKDGRANWDLVPATSDAAGDAPGERRGILLSEARITDGELRFADGVSGARYDLVHVGAVLRLPDLAGPAHLALTGQIRGQRVAVDLSASPAAALLSGDMVTAKIDLAAGRNALGFEGSFGHTPLKADGALHLDAADHAALAAVLGLPVPEVPPGFGARQATLDGRAVLSPDLRLVLRDGVLILDDNRLRVNADVQTAGLRPSVTAALTAETALVVPLAAGDGGAGDGQGGAGGGWSKASIDLSPLKALNADITFAAPAVTAGPFRLGTLRGRLALTDGRAVVSLSELAAYEGRVSGTVIANSAGRGSARADLVVEDLALQPLLRDAAGSDRLLASVNGTVSVISSTASVHDMMHRLQGEGRFSMGKGELRGLDLLGMLRTLDAGYVGEGQKTIFDSVSTGFSIADGVLRADDLTLSAPYLRVAGTGTVGIGSQSLDYRLVPVALQDTDGTGGLSVPLKITGPWAAPRFQLDTGALAKPKLDAERARAERRLAERLGADAENGETLEDAAKRKLETELRRGLGKLFGN